MKTILHTLQERYGLLVVAVALTLLVRLAYGLVVFEHIADRFSWRSDDRYSDLAYTIATCGKYAFSETSLPTMTRLPVHPLMLAGIYTIFGRSPVAVRAFQSLLGAMTCVMIYLAARKVTNGRVASVASLIFAFYPNSILYSARTLSETTYLFLISVFCFMLVRQFRAPGVWESVASGISFGMLMLTKGTTVLLPPFLLLILLSAYYRKQLWRVIGSMVLTAFVAALVMLPWVIRNYRLTDRFIPLSTWGGVPFYQGYYVATHLGDGRSGRQLDHDARREIRRLVQERYVPIGQPIDEYYRDRIAYSLAWEKVETRPLYSFWIFLRNAFLAWFLTYRDVTTIVSFFVHVPLLSLAIYAVLAMWRWEPSAWVRTLPLVLVCAYFNLFHAAIYPHARYMSPVTGTIVTILAAYGIVHLISLVSPSWANYPDGNPRKAGVRRS